MNNSELGIIIICHSDFDEPSFETQKRERECESERGREREREGEGERERERVEVEDDTNGYSADGLLLS